MHSDGRGQAVVNRPEAGTQRHQRDRRRFRLRRGVTAESRALNCQSRKMIGFVDQVPPIRLIAVLCKGALLMSTQTR